VLRRLMRELERPQTPDRLAAGLGVSEDVLTAMLKTLERKGYVGLAYPESPTCSTSCQTCSLKNLCPAAGAPAPVAPPVWRLTELGKQVVESSG